MSTIRQSAMSGGRIGFVSVSRPEKKGPVVPTANLHVRWAAVRPMKERHPFDVGNPRVMEEKWR
jgi:hypothetical protein